MTRNKHFVVSLFLAVLTLAVGTTYAQPGGAQRPVPSGTGGSVGGPSMSGDAVNAGMGDAPDISAPAGNGGGRPQGGGGRPAGGQGGERPTGMTGGGFTPPSGEGSVNLSARFGERGGGNFQLDSFLPGEGESWFQFGGFGSRGEGDTPHQGGNMEGAPWHTSGNIPEVPAAFSDLEAVTQAQINAQTAVDAAQGQATDAVNQASMQAQAAYDQFWTDYYTAVDYTAQTYYDTVTASADYMLQTYEEAVNYSMDSVDYYIAYAEQYASYCAAYPWDCYSYTYDASTNSYYYVGDTSDAPVSTVTLGDVTINVSYPVGIPAPSAEAYEALVVFANDQLGAVVEPLYAGVATDSVQALMTYVPDEIEAYYMSSTSISAVTYWGLLNGGAAGVAVGDCSTGNCTVSQENLSLQLSSASSGAYGIFASASVPTTPEAALALITQVYPKLDGLAFSQITDVEQGLAFTATTAGLGLDPTTGQPLSVAKVIYAGVVDVNGQPFVYTLVAVGEGHVGTVTG
jgi:hypothetical protein